MPYPSLQPTLEQCFEQGFAVFPHFIPENTATEISRTYFAEAGEETASLNPINLINTPLEQPANHLKQEVRLAGFDYWDYSNVFLKNTRLDSLIHRDNPDLRDISFLLYLKGITRMNLGYNPDQLTNDFELHAGDLLVLKGLSYSLSLDDRESNDQPDERMWHTGKNSDFSTERAFAHLGYRFYGDVAFDIATHKMHYVD